MQIADTFNSLRSQVKAWRLQNQTIAFVPTMGNLHQGHLSLVTKAKELADRVIVSIFVNPLQFDDPKDLSAYPRTLTDDIQQLTSQNCDVVFTPSIDIIYPHGVASHTKVIVPGSEDKLCGKNRPGHFDGVTTIVAKLFNMVQADIAIFGQKDYQQLTIIQKMVQDLTIAVEIIGAPIIREDNGLAMSSRNQYLTKQQRQQAAGLYQTLLAVEGKLQQGNMDFGALQQQAMDDLQRLGFQPEYVDIRCADDLEQAKLGDKNLRILAAARLGKARLIDNVACYLA